MAVLPSDKSTRGRSGLLAAVEAEGSLYYQVLPSGRSTHWWIVSDGDSLQRRWPPHELLELCYVEVVWQLCISDLGTIQYKDPFGANFSTLSGFKPVPKPSLALGVFIMCVPSTRRVIGGKKSNCK
eukprot:15325544-Ditylum_brightwellii.AAC.1